MLDVLEAGVEHGVEQRRGELAHSSADVGGVVTAVGLAVDDGRRGNVPPRLGALPDVFVQRPFGPRLDDGAVDIARHLMDVDDTVLARRVLRREFGELLERRVRLRLLRRERGLGAHDEGEDARAIAECGRLHLHEQRRYVEEGAGAAGDDTDPIRREVDVERGVHRLDLVVRSPGLEDLEDARLVEGDLEGVALGGQRRRHRRGELLRCERGAKTDVVGSQGDRIVDHRGHLCGCGVDVAVGERRLRHDHLERHPLLVEGGHLVDDGGAGAHAVDLLACLRVLLLDRALLHPHVTLEGGVGDRLRLPGGDLVIDGRVGERQLEWDLLDGPERRNPCEEVRGEAAVPACRHRVGDGALRVGGQPDRGGGQFEGLAVDGEHTRALAEALLVGLDRRGRVCLRQAPDGDAGDGDVSRDFVGGGRSVDPIHGEG